MVEKIKIGHVITYAFPERKTFLDYIENKSSILIAVNAEKVVRNAPRLHKIINDNIGFSDGTGAVMALKQKGLQSIKIPGCEFWLDIVRRYHKQKTFFLIGSSQDVIEQTVLKLQREYPDINIIGYQNGYLDACEIANVKKKLIASKPDIVFVAQGSPRQEYLMEDLFKSYSALYMGLGGSFDIYCGLKKRAPKFFINMHAEWLYRLLKEPTRFRRQLVLLRFIVLLKMGKL